MANSSTLSFGIELEMMFVFRNALLDSYLNQNPPESIKDTYSPYNTLSSLRYAVGRRGITTAATEHPTTDPSVRNFDNSRPHREDIHFPSTLTQSLFKSFLPPSLNAKVTPNSKEEESYSSWLITNDSSLRLIPPYEMDKHLPPHAKGRSRGYRSSGVELVSPPSQDIDCTLSEVETILSSITRQPEAHLAISEECGFHVHIGHADGSAFEPEVIKHLIWLLILFEPCLANMHERQRVDRSSHIMDEITPLREPLLADGAYKVERAVKDVSGASAVKEYACNYLPLSDFKEDLFRPAVREQTSEARLAHTVRAIQHSRAHSVNFQGLIDQARPNTIEFRQHAGTLDVEAMKRWIDFCRQLVRTAQRLHENEQAGTLSSIEQRILDIDDWIDVELLKVEDLFDVMQLDRQSREYVAAKTRENSHYQDQVFWETPEGYWDLDDDEDDDDSDDHDQHLDAEKDASFDSGYASACSAVV